MVFPFIREKHHLVLAADRDGGVTVVSAVVLAADAGMVMEE